MQTWLRSVSSCAHGAGGALLAGVLHQSLLMRLLSLVSCCMVWAALPHPSLQGSRIAFTTRSPGSPSDPPRGPLQLWVADVASGVAVPLLGERRLNTVFDSYSW
jgi:hypothetical protein